MSRGLLLAWLLLAACEKPPGDAVENSTPSPNASILPAPLSPQAQAAEAIAQGTTGAGGRRAEPSGKIPADADAPQTLRGDQGPGDDPIALRDLTGVRLDAEWRYPDPGPPHRAPEVNAAAVDAARRATAPRVTIELASAGRLRMILATRGFPLAKGTEIRARADRYGSLLVWPNGSLYRVLPPGAVRTLLEERRIDAIPLVRPDVVRRAEGARRLGLPTRRFESSSRTGALTIEQARVVAAGEGGALLCRLLSELVAIDPREAPCAPDEVPLRAQITWPSGGALTFEVLALADKVELPAAQVLAPPPAATLAASGLPLASSDAFLSREELSSFRYRSLDPTSARGLSPSEGLVVQNRTDVPRYVLVDGVPIAWVAPGKEQVVSGLVRGRYVVQLRTFLGDVIEAAASLELPARVAAEVGPADGGRER